MRNRCILKEWKDHRIGDIKVMKHKKSENLRWFLLFSKFLIYFNISSSIFLRVLMCRDQFHKISEFRYKRKDNKSEESLLVVVGDYSESDLEVSAFASKIMISLRNLRCVRRWSMRALLQTTEDKAMQNDVKIAMTLKSNSRW